MLIGELSKKTGLTKDAIRLYEKQGLIKVTRTERRVNNYKEYSNDTLRRLLLVKKIKSYGFTLSESAEIINLIDARLNSCKNIAGMVEEKINIIEGRIKELAELRILLKNSVDCCWNDSIGNPENIKCGFFDIN